MRLIPWSILRSCAKFLIDPPSTARTLLSDLTTADIAERCLAHVIPGVRRHYDLSEYADKKRAAFDALANRVQRIVGPKANVVEFKKAKALSSASAARAQRSRA
jgi:hypothetical protein